MKAIEKIDAKIKELQKIRRIVVKGEKKFNQDDIENIEAFERDLQSHGIKYSKFTYATSLFIKIDKEDSAEELETKEIEEN